MDLTNVLVCRECKELPSNLIEDSSSGDVICESCGVVLQDRIPDEGAEWRSFANDDQGNDDPSRVGDGPNMLLNGDQLQTTIGMAQRMGKNARTLARTQQKMTRDKATTNLMETYHDIDRMCESMKTGSAISTAAKFIYKQLDDAKAMKGKSQEATIAAVIFIACRKAQAARSFKELYAYTHVPKKDIGRAFKQVEAFLQNNASTDHASDPASAILKATTSAEDLCDRYCNHLRLKHEMRGVRVSRALADKAYQVPDLAGRSPLSVAAACLYMASYIIGEPKTTKEIAKVTGVSDGTVKTAYRHLYQAKSVLATLDPTILPGGQETLDKLPVT